MGEIKEVQETVTAADVNIKKAEEYRSQYRDEEIENIPKRTHKLRDAFTLIAFALILGIVAAAVFQGVSWYRFSRAGQNEAAMSPGTKGDADALGQGEGREVGAVSSDAEGAVGAEGTVDAEGMAGVQGAFGAEGAAGTQATVTDVSFVAGNVMPAVVAIKCDTESTVLRYDFWGRTYEEKEQGSSAGTGILIGQGSNEVLIVTNNHVVDNAVKVEVIFCDNAVAAATVKGVESANDLAVISVDLGTLPEATLKAIRIATLGDSDSARMGEMVIAIGNALGYGQSVTVGFISALNREVTVDDVTLNLLQVDAAINPGNSGGALLNANGEVIGINSVKYSSEEVEGVGYAIPISEVIPIIVELMNREELEESEAAYLAISGIDIDTAYSNSFKMPVGIYVSRVEEGSPEAEAGLYPGDIIVGINGRKISTMGELQTVLGYTRGGTEVTLQLKVLENGAYVDKELKVVLGYRPQK